MKWLRGKFRKGRFNPVESDPVKHVKIIPGNTYESLDAQLRARFAPPEEEELSDEEKAELYEKWRLGRLRDTSKLKDVREMKEE